MGEASGDVQIDRQAGRQTDRQMDRQTDMQTQTDWCQCGTRCSPFTSMGIGHSESGC